MAILSGLKHCPRGPRENFRMPLKVLESLNFQISFKTYHTIQSLQKSFRMSKTKVEMLERKGEEDSCVQDLQRKVFVFSFTSLSNVSDSHLTKDGGNDVEKYSSSKCSSKNLLLCRSFIQVPLWQWLSTFLALQSFNKFPILW